MTPDLNDPLSGPFWRAAREQRLVTCHCERCERDVWYPRESCPDCGGVLSWRDLSGRATLLSWTTVRRQINGAFDVPYTPAIVIPDDAPEVQLVTQLVLDGGTTPYCDMPLAVDYIELAPLQGEPFMAPVFRPEVE